MKQWLLAAILSLVVTVGNAAYTQLEARYQEVKRSIAGEADRLYFEGLREIEQQLMDAGRPRSVLAVRQERERFQRAGNMDEGAKLDNLDVAALIAKVQGWRDERTLELLRSYCSRLESLVAELTRSNRLEEAIKVEQRLENAKNQMAFYETRSAESDAQAGDAEPAPRPAREHGDLAQRLRDIRIERFQVSANNPIDAFNSFAGIVHPHNVTFRLEAEKVPIASVTFDPRTGVPRFARHWGTSLPQPLITQALVLTSTTALDVLQSICDVHGLGYAFDTNTLIITDPDNPRATWRRLSLTADALAQQFVDAPPNTTATFGRESIRVTGPIINISRGLAGRTTAVLHADIPIHIEMEAPLHNPDEWRRLEAAVEQQRQSVLRQTRSGGRPIRRLGEDIELTPPPATGYYWVFSAVAEFDTHSRRAVSLKNGREARWQHVYRHQSR